MRTMEGIKGGFSGHIFRRSVHVGMIFVPFIYYYFFMHHLHVVTLHHIIVALIVMMIAIEMVRMRFQFLFFAQRSDEIKRVSSLTWTVFSVAMILIFSPSVGFSVAIISSCALADPLLGEMRLCHANKNLMFFCALLLVFLIWMICAALYSISFWYAIFMAIIIVAAESIKVSWMDDNALMMLIPLVVVLVV